MGLSFSNYELNELGFSKIRIQINIAEFTFSSNVNNLMGQML